MVMRPATTLLAVLIFNNGVMGCGPAFYCRVYSSLKKTLKYELVCVDLLENFWLALGSEQSKRIKLEKLGNSE